MIARRHLLGGGGAMFAALALPPARAADVLDVAMAGRPDGSHVWFDPVGLLVRPGQTVRWTNRDPGNSHTSTAYHPDAAGRSRRIPKTAEPWDSGYLLPGESFAVSFTVPGVYDYYCLPHEHAGMVGRIVVGDLPATGWWVGDRLHTDPDLPEVALRSFPDIAEIVARGSVPPG